MREFRIMNHRCRFFDKLLAKVALTSFCLTLGAGIGLHLSLLTERAFAQRVSEQDDNRYESSNEALLCRNGRLDTGESCDIVNGAAQFAQRAPGVPAQYRFCDSQCTAGIAPYCGDRMINQSSEQCDTNNFADLAFPPADYPLMPLPIFNQKTCSNCRVFYPNFCGDARKAGREQCDDGNSLNSDSCLRSCISARCGDGAVWSDGGREECDLGRHNSNQPNAPCRTNCLAQRCGDSIVDRGEDCDTGETVSADGTRTPNDVLGCQACNCPGPDSCGRPCGNRFYGMANCCAGVPVPGDYSYWFRSGAWDHYVTVRCVAGFRNLSFFAQWAQQAGTQFEGQYIYNIEARRSVRDMQGVQHACYTCAWVRVIGCFAPETKILLADGSEREIQDISAGDMVLNPTTGKGVKVRSLLESYEDQPLIEVAYGGRLLRVTSKHPMVTQRGVIPANALLPSDSVQTSDGNFHTIEQLKTLPLEPKQRVINLELDTRSETFSDRYIVAEGMVTGDLLVQKLLAEKGK